MERSKDKEIILVAGFPGTGKSHLGRELAEQLRTPDRSVEHVSFGDRVRRIAGKVGSLAVPASDYTDDVIRHLSHPYTRFQLLGDNIAAGITEEILSEHESTNLLILDGYPRNTSQYTDLDRLIALRPDKPRAFRGMIVTTASEETALSRLIQRNPRHMEGEVTEEIALNRLVSGRHELADMLNYSLLRIGPWQKEIDTSMAKSQTVKLGLEAVKNFYSHPYQ